MPITIFAVGLVALIAAIVGGGLSMFGITFPPLQSKVRQTMLVILGLILMCVGGWPQIQARLFPPRTATETYAPTDLEPGKTQDWPILLKRHGSVDIVIVSLEPQGNEIYASICSSDASVPCARGQIGASRAFSQTLPVGPATVSFFNFPVNPKVRFVLKVSYPE